MRNTTTALTSWVETTNGHVITGHLNEKVHQRTVSGIKVFEYRTKVKCGVSAYAT